MEFMEHPYIFPHPDLAEEEGVLCLGGHLDVTSLVIAYNFGIFPWYDTRYEPVFWWAPIPRFVIFPDEVVVSKSMRSYFNQGKFSVTYDQCFESVIRHCQQSKRKGQRGTWIDEDIVKAYVDLFHIGLASSVEVWQDGLLVGGLYGVKIGKMFYGESMFSKVSNASKFGFITLCRKLESEGFFLIDCQQPNEHLKSLGGRFITGDAWNKCLFENRKIFLQEGTWPL